MELLVKRTPATDRTILGELFLDGVFEAFTLERSGVEIPPGRYPVTLTMSQRFGRVLPLVWNVPGRAGIRIHPLNSARDTDGCIGVGQEATVTSILHSRLAMQALQPKIAAALKVEEVHLTIEPPQTTSQVNA